MNDGANTKRRILVVANEVVDADVLHEAIRSRAGEVLVVAPELNSRLRNWASEIAPARRAAEQRVVTCLDRLGRVGIPAVGWVGDADPLQAIGDALSVFEADEIVLATQSGGDAHWLERNLVARARRRFVQPILHVVVDPARSHVRVAA